MNLLIVDDNENMRRTLRSVLGDVAEHIHECPDASQALAAYDAHRPDWVLMDIRMAGTDGLAATREICRVFPGAKVVIVTNYDGEEFREAARGAGAHDFVVKSNLLDLRRILRAG